MILLMFFDSWLRVHGWDNRESLILNHSPKITCHRVDDGLEDDV